MAGTSDEVRDQNTAARRVLPVFAGSRLVAIRELLGRTQAEVAKATGISPSALSQAERGDTTLSSASIAHVASHLGVSPEAFVERHDPELRMKPQFRHLRRTSVREQRKAERFVFATARVANILRDRVEFPGEPFSFAYSVNPEERTDDVAEEIERAAARTRSALGLSENKPIGFKLIDKLEDGGVTVVRDRETDQDIDAYSAVVGQLPVIVLDGGKGSVWDRDNFNLAHELGHIVMHLGIRHTPGTRTVEAQAHRFAGAFLGPDKTMREVLPRDLDWGHYLELKREWGMSMAALVRRAKDLGVIDDAMYTRAMKQRSAYGLAEGRTQFGLIGHFPRPASSDARCPRPRFSRHV